MLIYIAPILQYEHYVSQLPLQDDPALLGMHHFADASCATATGYTLFSSLRAIAPRTFVEFSLDADVSNFIITVKQYSKASIFKPIKKPPHKPFIKKGTLFLVYVILICNFHFRCFGV